MKKILFGSLCMVLLLLTACATGEPVRRYCDYLSIEIPDTMQSAGATDDGAAFAMAYVQDECQLTVLAEDKAEIAQEYAAETLEQYAALVLEKNAVDAEPIYSAEGNLCAEFETNMNGTWCYFYYVFLDDDTSYLTVQFGALREDRADFAPRFRDWEATIELL
ncbi:MAG: hypothetical protein LBM28_01285 [Oscillospiraceae bacterium]|jgi:hypothetical protein|nr:hypothetical protein [Oscillospiraceae bacterium]